MKSIMSILCLSAVLTACGGNVKQDLACTGENWEALGYSTATSGKSVRSFDRYRDGCGDKLEKNAIRTYLDGYTRGILEFCTFDKGYELGFGNKTLPDVCPVELRDQYVKGYRKGQLEINAHLSKMDRLKEEQESLDRAIQNEAKPMSPADSRM